MNTVLEAQGLTKSFGSGRKKTLAVDHVDLKIGKGEIYGFVGRNGAGKTTTIRMLLGMIGPDSGTISIMGTSVGRDRGPWGRVGALVEAAVAWPDLTVLGNLRTLADLHGIKAPLAIDRVLGLLNLEALAQRQAQSLSLGNLQRLALAMALLPQPEVLILDEPINGLDPAGVVQVRELLKEEAGTRGTTIFVSSHLLDEVARTCSRIGILHQGRLIQEVGGQDLERLSSHRLIVGTPDPRGATRALTQAGISVRTTSTEGELDLGEAPPEAVAPVLVAAKVPLTKLVVESEDLEDYFLKITGGRE